MSGLARSSDTGRWLMIAAGVVVLATVLAIIFATAASRVNGRPASRLRAAIT